MTSRSGAVFLALALCAMLANPCLAATSGSTCYGTSAQGRLAGGVRLPLGGTNFSAYSVAGWGIGRTYVHDTVRDVLVDAFRELESTAPGKVFVYGETGFPAGGRFPPHRTHRNGLSVDLMVPVLRDDASVPLPGSVFNRFGYDLEFDGEGRLDDYRIDFDALAQLVLALDRTAKARGIGIARVIFDVPLQRHLWRAQGGRELRRQVAFSTRPAWVRHDEHIHVDFAVPCSAM
jgi:penicillin-insensitive murein endopeptidase